MNQESADKSSADKSSVDKSPAHKKSADKEQVASYCGLACEECDAFVATKNNDNQLKTQVAARWTRLYNKKIQAEEVFCRGCKSPGPKGIYCQTMCPIKPCCRKKGFDSCAPCPEFPCKDLKAVFVYCPEAEARVGKIS